MSSSPSVKSDYSKDEPPNFSEKKTSFKRYFLTWKKKEDFTEILGVGLRFIMILLLLI